MILTFNSDFFRAEYAIYVSGVGASTTWARPDQCVWHASSWFDIKFNMCAIWEYQHRTDFVSLFCLKLRIESISSSLVVDQIAKIKDNQVSYDNIDEKSIPPSRGFRHE